MTNRTK